MGGMREVSRGKCQVKSSKKGERGRRYCQFPSQPCRRRAMKSEIHKNTKSGGGGEKKEKDAEVSGER